MSVGVRTIELPRESWCASIATLRAYGLPSMREYADCLEQQLEQHLPDQATVGLHLTDTLVCAPPTEHAGSWGFHNQGP